MERHLSHSDWTRVLAGNGGIDVDAAVAHLKGCRACWDVVAGVVAELKRRGIPLRFQDARDSVVGVLDSEEKAALRWLLAQSSWIRLRDLDVEEQIKRLRAAPALRTRDMFDAVLTEASIVAPDDPYLGEERAMVAYALADMLPEDACPRPLREDLQGTAMLEAAKARRLTAAWTGSAAAIEQASRHFGKGSGEPVWAARLLSIQASLASDTGHLEKSLTLLARAAEIARHKQDLLASLAVQEANTLLAAFRYEEAVARAEEALGLLGPGEVRLEMLARSIVVESLIFLGRPSEALRCFSAILPLYEQLPGRRSELRQGYLEALLLDAFGFSREAEKAFRANVAGFMAAEQYKDAFLVLLTYFETLVSRGLPDKAENLIEDALALTKQAGSGCHSQMIDLWRGLLSLLQAGRLVGHHLAEAREYLVRSWHAPAAQGPLRQTARAVVGPRISSGGQEREPVRAVREEPEPQPLKAQPTSGAATTGGYHEEMERLDRELVARGLAQSGGRIREAARLLGLARDTLRTKVRKYGLETAGSDDVKLLSANDQGDPALPQEELRTVLSGMRARACWAELTALPAAQQIRRLESVPTQQTLEMLDAVLASAISAAWEDPVLGEQRALVAHTLAGLLPAACFSHRQRADFQGRAMQIVMNCRRRAGNFSGSASALAAAARHIGSGTGDAALKARLLSLQASLAADSGHPAEALRLLARAAAICRQSGASTASITVQEANTLLAAFRYQNAIARAEAALRALAPGELHLELLARSIITESLAQLGRADEALRSLYTSLPLYERLRGHRTELQLGYLQALVLDSLGYAREAEDAFRANVAGWMEAEHYKDALLILLTQFERLYRRGEIKTAMRVGREALRQFEEAEPEGHAHVRDLWHNLLSLVESRGLTEHKLLEARDFAMGAFAKPAARPVEPRALLRDPARRLLHVEPATPVGHLAPGDYKKALERRDRQLVAAALVQCRGRMRETCRLLGISEPTLREKMKKYGLKG